MSVSFHQCSILTSSKYVYFQKDERVSLGELSKQSYVFSKLGESKCQEFTIRFQHTAFHTSGIQQTNPLHYPQYIMILVAEVLGMGISRSYAKTGNPLAKHNPRYSCIVPVSHHNNAFRNQERPPSAGLRRQPTFGWVTVKGKQLSLSVPCCENQIACYLSCIQL